MVPLLRLWLWISVFATLAGWTLSALVELNRAGYAAALGLFAIFVILRRKDLQPDSATHGFHGRKWLRRFRRPLPLGFAALATLVFVGGALYPPGNYTGLNYRVARVLQWLAQEHWHWIHTNNFRMNDRACGMEWLSAGLLCLTRTDRVLFLLNFLPYLLLPGLFFSVSTRLGVRARVAWHWMWLLPTGYNFLLQAGGIANDTFPTVYALAALDFGLRAWKSRRAADLWHSILAAALLTGAKASNLPLLLPWALAIFPLVPLLRRKFAAMAIVIILAAAVSFLPTAILNFHYLHDWSGLSIEDTGMNMNHPLVGVWGNVLLLLLNNFLPPLFPLAGWWNLHALNLLPHFLAAPMVANFEHGFLQLPELQTEDWAGLGFGLSILLAVSVCVAALYRRAGLPVSSNVQPVPAGWRQWILLAPWLGLLAYTMKSGMVTPQRLIAPYYPLLLPLLLVGLGQAKIVRRRWWRTSAAIVWGLALMVLVLTPDRPLWPAKTILSSLAARHPRSRPISHALAVYTVYAQRSDPLAGVRPLLPRDIKVVGFIADSDDNDYSLWLPLGTRKVRHFLADDPPEAIRKAGVEYVVVGGLNLQMYGMTLDQWLAKSRAQLVGSITVTEKVSEGPQPWYVVRLMPPAGG
ncbi:MAG: hypothetical protein ABSE16_16185 [Verrucomicrobiota bacterium]|jgi:hypothetical protein